VIFSLALEPPSFDLTKIPGNVVLSWANPAFSLQSAPEVTGVNTNNRNVTSPYTNPIAGSQRFFWLSQ